MFQARKEYQMFVAKLTVAQLCEEFHERRIDLAGKMIGIQDGNDLGFLTERLHDELDHLDRKGRLSPAGQDLLWRVSVAHEALRDALCDLSRQQAQPTALAA